MANIEKLGSSSPEVLLKNATNLDQLVNGRESESLPDRFGVLRKTWHGMEMIFSRFIDYITGRGEQAVAAIGWQELGNWAVGLAVDNRQQIVYYNGSWYKYLGELEHVIAGDSPENDGGVWSAENPTGKWSNIGDAALRSNLGSSEHGEGGYLVEWARNDSCETAANVAVFLSAQKINLWEYKHLCVPKVGDPATLDWAPALLKALKDGAKKRKAVYAPGMDDVYYISKLGEILTNLDTSGSESRMSVYALVGDGANHTRFYSDEMTSPVMELSLCRLLWKGWSLSGPGINSTYGIKLGEATTISAVRLSYVEDVKIGWFSNPLVVGHLWDSIFNNLHIQYWG
ncbi:hypothetical protein ACPFA1_003994, partial [Klebsiella pneumoniae]